MNDSRAYREVKDFTWLSAPAHGIRLRGLFLHVGLRLISAEDGRILLYFHAPQHVTSYALLKYK